MQYRIAIKQKVMSFNYDHWNYALLDGSPSFNKKASAEYYAQQLNKRDKRVAGDRFDWYYSVIEHNEKDKT